MAGRLTRAVTRWALALAAGPGRALQGALLFAVLLKVRPFLDVAHYLARRPRCPRVLARIHYAFVGSFAQVSPNPWFDPAAYLRENPRVGGMAVNVALHYLLFGRYGGRGVASGPAGTLRHDPVGDDVQRLDALWPAISAEMHALQDVESALTPVPHVREWITGNPRRVEPGRLGRLHAAMMAALPRGADHFVVVPWLGVDGGSERVTRHLLRLLRERIGPGRLCVVGPDSGFDLPPAARGGLGIPVLAFNDFEPGLEIEERVELLDRLVVQGRPRVVHVINSWIGWLLLERKGQFLAAAGTKLFGNLYSAARGPDGGPTGVFWRCLPRTLPYMTGFLADNLAVTRFARACFGLTAAEMRKLHLVPTPVVGGGSAPSPTSRSYGPGRGRTSLWMSRIAAEKRLDVLAAIAERRPDRRFLVYGAAAGQSFEVDTSALARRANIELRGRFGTLDDLPAGECDSFVYTTQWDGMPIAILEAVQLGLPVVAPDVGGIGEVIGPDTGWLVPDPGDVDGYIAALGQIEGDPDEAARRCRAAQALVSERHGWASFSAAVAAIPGYLG